MTKQDLHIETRLSIRWRIVFWGTFCWITLYVFGIFYSGGAIQSRTVHWHLLTPIQAWAIWINYEPLVLVIPTIMANLILLLAAWRITVRRNARLALGAGFSLHAILFFDRCRSCGHTHAVQSIRYDKNLRIPRWHWNLCGFHKRRFDLTTDRAKHRCSTRYCSPCLLLGESNMAFTCARISMPTMWL